MFPYCVVTTTEHPRCSFSNYGIIVFRLIPSKMLIVIVIFLRNSKFLDFTVYST